MNLAAIDEFTERHPDLDVVLVESGGDNLAATFNPELADYFLFVISVAEGEDIPASAALASYRPTCWSSTRRTSHRTSTPTCR